MHEALRSTLVVVAALACAIGCVAPQPFTLVPLAAPDEKSQMASVVEAVREKGPTRVMIRLEGAGIPEIPAPSYDANATRSSVIPKPNQNTPRAKSFADAQSKFLQKFDGGDEQKAHRFESAPYLAMDLNLSDALKLQNWMKEEAAGSSGRPFKIWVEADTALKKHSAPALFGDVHVATAATYMGFDTAAAVSGKGSTVVIIDDRIDDALHLLNSRVEELCEIDPTGTWSARGRSAEAEPTSYNPSHGTMLALIVGAAAPSARIIGIDIFVGTPDESSVERLITGLEYVYKAWPGGSARKIAAVCVSLGDETRYTSGSCDCDRPPLYSGCAVLNPAMRDYVNLLAAVQIPVVIAAGNSAPYRNNVYYPACLTGAVTVGASTGGFDGTPANRAGVSNWGNMLDVCAQGDSLLLDMDAWMSPPGPAPAKLFGSGTSFAVPFVCAAYSVLLDSHPEWTNAKIGEAVRKGRGVLSWAVTVPELQVANASAWLDNNPPTGPP